MKRQVLPIIVAGTLFGACNSEPARPAPAAPPEPAQKLVLEGPADNEDLELKMPGLDAAELASALADRAPSGEEGVSASVGSLSAAGEASASTPQTSAVTKRLVISDSKKSAKNGGKGGGSLEHDLERALNSDMFAGTGKGDAFGVGGLGLHGAGRGGGGIGYGSIGNGSLGVKGSSGYGRGVGVVGNRARPAPVRVQREPESNSESYADYGTNKFTDPTEDRFSTFSIDVDTGSYTIARSKLNSGARPPKASVRVEEFVNYFGYNYPKPKEAAFRVSMEAAPSPFSSDGKAHLLRIGVQGKTIAAAERKPVHLTFLVDVSGSMMSPDKLQLAQKSLRILTQNLGEGDTVAMATYAGRTEVLLEPTSSRGAVLDAIDRLTAGGSTAMASGLDLAYGLAEKNLRPDHENRVIVLSDGDANVGRTGHQAMLDQIAGQVKKGITLSTIGFGMGNYKDTTMEQLANKGNGNYYYVDSEKEALKVFGDQLDGTLQVIAKDVKLQVEFNPDAVHRYRLIGYENRDIADKDFRNDKVDAGEIGAGHTVTALYEVELKDELPEQVATVRVRHKEPRGSDKASEQAFSLGADMIRGKMADASADFQFAAAVAAFAEKLRESPYAAKLTYAWIIEIAEGAVRGKADRKEFVALVKKAARA